MADEQVLKSFLVSLGFKTDQQSQKSMLRTVAEVTASLRNLAAVAVAATAAAGVAIAKMASDLDELYYSSKRIGSSANEIKAFGHAVGQLGGSAEGAVTSLENLARNIRQSPGYIGLLRRLGVQTHDSAGNMRDMTVQMVELGEQLRKMPTHLAYQFADLLGIDEKTLLAMREGVGEFSDEYKALLAATGNDLDGSARDAHEVMQTWRTSWAITGLLITKITSSILKALQPLAKAFNSNVGGMARAADKFISFLSRMVRRVYQLIQDINALVAKFWEPLRQVIDWIAAKFDSMGEHGRAALLGIRDGAILAAAAIALFLAPITTISAALLLLYDDWKTYREGGLFSLPWDELEKRWNHMGDTIANVGKTIKEWFTKQLNAARQALDDLYQAAAKFWSGGGKKMTEKTMAAATGSAPAQAAPAPTKPPAKPAPAKPAASTTKQAQPEPAPTKPTPEQAAKAANETTGVARSAAVNELAMVASSPYGQLLAKGEGSRYGYDAYNAGTKGTPIKINSKGEKYQSVVHGGSYKAATGRAITDMTIGEILSAGQGTGMDKARIYVAGKYQFATETLRGLVKAEGIPLSTKFTPEVQDMLFAAHLKRRAPSVYAYATGKSDSYTAKDWNTVAAEWRSMPDTSGKTYQDKWAGSNRVMHTVEQTKAALDASRAAMMNRGLPSAPPSVAAASPSDGSLRPGVTINQTTNVNVTGAVDPTATASAVTGAQNHVNQQLARNARSAVVG